MDRIVATDQRRRQYYFSINPFSKDRKLEPDQLKPEGEKIEKNLEMIREELSEIDYFVYLVNHQEIEDKKIIRYYAPLVLEMLTMEIRHHVSTLKHHQWKVSKHLRELPPNTGPGTFITYSIFGLKVDLERFEERIDNIITTWETIKTTAGGDDDESRT